MHLNTLSLPLHMQRSQPCQQQSISPLLFPCHQLCTQSIPSPQRGIINRSTRLTRTVRISLMPTDLQIWKTKDTATDNSSRLTLQQTAQIPIFSCHNYKPVSSRTPSFSTATLNMLLHKNCSSSQSQVGSRGRGTGLQSNMFITSHSYRPHRYQTEYHGRAEVRKSQLRDCCVLFSEHVLLLNWLISEVWAAVSINCCLHTHPKKYQQESWTKWKSTGKTHYLMNRCLQQFFKTCASSQVSAALQALSKSMYTNIIATVTTVTATPRHIDLTSWNHWTIKARKDLLDHCVQWTLYPRVQTLLVWAQTLISEFQALLLRSQDSSEGLRALFWRLQV